MRVGIFGGSFNPVHEGHLKLAKEALSELNLDRVIFVPSNQNPLKKATGLMSSAQRVARLEKALKGKPGFSVDLREMRRKGPSFTVDTLKSFKEEFGKKAVLYFLAGADALVDFHRWKSPEQILKLCRFAVFSRPGVRAAGRAPEGVLKIPMEAAAISSTQIRKRSRSSNSSLK